VANSGEGLWSADIFLSVVPRSSTVLGPHNSVVICAVVRKREPLLCICLSADICQWLKTSMGTVVSTSEAVLFCAVEMDIFLLLLPLFTSRA